ncbi:hypothetical protein LEMLEM_LOCUS2906 [Lemmus lemmus]
MHPWMAGASLGGDWRTQTSWTSSTS